MRRLLILSLILVLILPVITGCVVHRGQPNEDPNTVGPRADVPRTTETTTTEEEIDRRTEFPIESDR